MDFSLYEQPPFDIVTKSKLLVAIRRDWIRQSQVDGFAIWERNKLIQKAFLKKNRVNCISCRQNWINMGSSGRTEESRSQMRQRLPIGRLFWNSIDSLNF